MQLALAAGCIDFLPQRKLFYTMLHRLQSVLERDSSPETQEKVRRAATVLNIVVYMPVPVSPSDPKEAYFVLNTDSQRLDIHIGTRDFFALPESVQRRITANFTHSPNTKKWVSKLRQGDDGFGFARQIVQETGLPDLTPQQESVNFSVLNIPLENIHIDKARFQPRDDFSEEKVSEIVQNFNPALFKPLIVWKDPQDAKTYVLAGHHRFEALKRMGRRSAPVVYAEGDEEQAVRLAWTENQSGRTQTAAENAKYLRKLKITSATQKELKDECTRLYGRSCTVALDISHLNPKGKALTDYKLLQPDSETFRDMETMCQWLGKVRGRFPELTDSHENEMYDFLRENYKIRGKKFTSSAEFGAFMENIITKRTSFGVIDERLNITTFTPANTVAAEYDAETARAERELAEARQVLKEKQEEAARRTDASPEQIDTILKKYNDAVILAQRELLRLKDAKADGVREAKASEMSLFGLGDAALKTKILEKWNDSSLSAEEREKVRRAGTVLGLKDKRSNNKLKNKP